MNTNTPDFKFDEERVADFSKWIFEFDRAEGVIAPEFWSEALKDIGQTVETELRDRTQIMLWNYAPTDKEGYYLPDNNFDPGVMIALPIGKDEHDYLEGRASLDGMVDYFIEMNTPDDKELQRWADYFTSLAKKLADAAEKSK